MLRSHRINIYFFCECSNTQDPLVGRCPAIAKGLRATKSAPPPGSILDLQGPYLTFGVHTCECQERHSQGSRCWYFIFLWPINKQPLMGTQRLLTVGLDCLNVKRLD